MTEGTAHRPAILVSACLLGVRCNHLGGASPSAAVLALSADNRLVAFCPETVGGLPTPRPAAERQPDGRGSSLWWITQARPPRGNVPGHHT